MMRRRRPSKRSRGGVATPRGFRAAGVSAGIKANGGSIWRCSCRTRRHGVGRLHDESARRRRRYSCRASISTRSGGVARAIMVNSGCANACTGEDGLRARTRMAADTARLSAARSSRCWSRRPASSASRCHRENPRRQCRPRSRRSARDQGSAAARAIMTTDPFPKEAAATRRRSAAATVTIGGMAKGSGMIEPMMATMLGFVTTDAAVPPRAARSRAARSGNETFNAITVDGECSTNDCVMLLANGASGVADRRDAPTTRSPTR